MKRLAVILLLAGTAGCCRSPLEPAPVLYPASILDGKPMYGGSWHKAHVKILRLRDLQLDDGSIIVLSFIGWPRPETVEGESGTVYASVPSFYISPTDDDSTYYFQKFVPDAKERAK